MSINEKYEYWTSKGWRYLSGGDYATGGTWYHDEHGSVNEGGGHFDSIIDAMTAIERFWNGVMAIRAS